MQSFGLSVLTVIAVAPPVAPAMAWTRLSYEKTFDKVGELIFDEDEIYSRYSLVCLQKKVRKEKRSKNSQLVLAAAGLTLQPYLRGGVSSYCFNF